MFGYREGPLGRTTHQVMTLSGTGEAETPAGGSVCMRYHLVSYDGSLVNSDVSLPTLKSRIKRRRAAVDIMTNLVAAEIGASRRGAR